MLCQKCCSPEFLIKLAGEELATAVVVPSVAANNHGNEPRQLLPTFRPRANIHIPTQTEEEHIFSLFSQLLQAQMCCSLPDL